MGPPLVTIRRCTIGRRQVTLSVTRHPAVTHIGVLWQHQPSRLELAAGRLTLGLHITSRLDGRATQRLEAWKAACREDSTINGQP